MRMLVVLVGMMGVLCSGNPAPGQTPSGDAGVESDSSVARPDFRLLRQEEDWSAWRGEDDWLGMLKNMRISHGGSGVLTVGGEIRAYARWYRNERWGAGPARDGYLLHRFMLHGSLEVSDTGDSAIRLFTQLKSGLISGRDGPLYPPDRDRLGVNQAFLEIGSTVDDGTLTMRVGRQELHYDAARMISVREGPNVRMGFDALLGRYRYGTWRIDAFAAKPTATSEGILDNGWIPGRTLWGIHAGHRSERTAHSVYYFGTRRRPSPTSKGLHATRHTLGARQHGTAGNLTYDAEAALQLGTFRVGETASKTVEAGPIRAWRVAGRLGYGVEELLVEPRLGVLADLSSGALEGTESHETFAAPYPSGRYTGAGSRLGPSNLIEVAPFLALTPISRVRLKLTSYFFWRSTPTDGIYAIWGAPLRSRPAREKQFVGVMPEGVLSVGVGRHVNLALEVSAFRPGPAFGAGASADRMVHLGLRGSFVF